MVRNSLSCNGVITAFDAILRLGFLARALFSYTEAAEYFPEQILAGEFAGDIAQGVLSQPQVFRE